MPLNVDGLYSMLFDKDNKIAYRAMQTLEKLCEETADVYAYMDSFADMLESDNSYIRARGLSLIAHNARWDKDNKIDEIIDRYLKHITDYKPTTARSCIKLLPLIAKSKPELRTDIISALHKADISVYAGSMQPLIYKDLQAALAKIQKM